MVLSVTQSEAALFQFPSCSQVLSVVTLPKLGLACKMPAPCLFPQPRPGPCDAGPGCCLSSRKSALTSTQALLCTQHSRLALSGHHVEAESARVHKHAPGFLVAQVVKSLPVMQEIRIRSLGREGPPEKGNTPVFSPRESHGQRSLAGYSPWDGKEPDTTEPLTPLP